MIQKPESLHASGEGIIHQLEHMLASPDFNVRAQLIAFLKFAVNRKLEGIKGYTITTEVFGHRSDFGPGYRSHREHTGDLDMRQAYELIQENPTVNRINIELDLQCPLDNMLETFRIEREALQRNIRYCRKELRIS